ncbi:MAG: hypothetical protein KDE45_02015 [Caldilineaceae bacterium]|nr:hypothetical protein [Caldilineaceae bacterium]
MAEPRGYRLNNPLNIRKTATTWVGLATRQPDADFCAFESPEYGIRAAAKILQTYQEKHGINTLRGVVSRWAPPEDNNDTSAYITAVSIWAGMEPDEQISLSDYAVVLPMLRAMCRVELGKPADGERWYDAATWEKGLRMAGLSPNKPLSQSRTTKGVATAGAGIAAAIGVLTDTFGIPPEIAGLLPSMLTSLTEQQTAAVVLLISLGGALYAAWARHDDKLKGRL